MQSFQLCNLEYPKIKQKKRKHKKLLKALEELILDCLCLLLTFGTEGGSQEAEPGPGPGACRQTGRG